MGTGLGLSISYSIVSKLGGTIECQSEEGVGTEFIVSLPRGMEARLSDGADELASQVASGASLEGVLA